MNQSELKKALLALGPNGNRGYIEELAEISLQILPKYNITTPLRLAHFWAQISHECNGFKTFEENLNYSVEGLKKTFNRSRISAKDAEKFGRTSSRPANKSAIANIIYGGKFGRKQLGNTQAGDGWKFRGRGIKQITGRYNYSSIGKKLGIDLLAAPDLLLRPEIGLRAACEFWKEKGLNALADKNDIVAITRKVNGGTNGLANRRANYVIAWRIFGNGEGLPKSGRAVSSKKDAAAATAIGAGGTIGPYVAYEAGKEMVQNASDIKETAKGAGEFLGVDGGLAIVIGLGMIVLVGVAFLLFRNWKRKDEEDSE